MAGVVRSRRWGYAAAAWAAPFAALHVFWALGGSAGLASSAGAGLAEDRPTWFVAGGLWGVGGLLLVAALLGVALARTDARTGLRRLLALGGAAVAAILLARGIGVGVLLLSGALDANTAVSARQRFWTLVLWNPWFVIGGGAFGLASAAAWPRKPSRLRPGPRWARAPR